jgi:hypothetical protein
VKNSSTRRDCTIVRCCMSSPLLIAIGDICGAHFFWGKTRSVSRYSMKSSGARPGARMFCVSVTITTLDLKKKGSPKPWVSILSHGHQTGHPHIWQERNSFQTPPEKVFESSKPTSRFSKIL